VTQKSMAMGSGREPAAMPMAHCRSVLSRKTAPPHDVLERLRHVLRLKRAATERLEQELGVLVQADVEALRFDRVS